VPARNAERDAEAFRPDDGVELAGRLKEGPVVVLGSVADAEVKVHIAVEETFRGSGVPARLTVAVRSPNLGRAPGTPPFRAEAGERAVFVLAPYTDLDGDVVKQGLWVPAGGYAGKIPLPAEGAEALIDAVRQIVAYQDGADTTAGVSSITAWLSGVNPWLIDFALDQAAQLGLADRQMAPALLARITDASALRRSRAVAALGLGLGRGRFDPRKPLPGRMADTDETGKTVREAIVRLARTDPAVDVRKAAVKQFGSRRIPGATDILTAIAKDDPAQDVRYEAAAALADLGALPAAR
jgi:hypothetical protein